MEVVMKVSREIVVAVEYCDYSGLEGETLKAAQDFCEELGTSTMGYMDATSFERCDVTGLHADCLTVVIFKAS